MPSGADMFPPSNSDHLPSSDFLHDAALHEGYYIICAYGVDHPHDVLDGPYYCVDDRAMVRQVSAIADPLRPIALRRAPHRARPVSACGFSTPH
jgi:hypothetical protein